MPSKNGPLRVGIGGPVGSGKTALTEKLCKAMRERYSLAVVTNDIYTKEDAEALVRMQALPSERIVGVETGGCPHTAIREDASINLQAIADLNRRLPELDLVFIESGGDNLAATFSPDLADLTIYVISVCQGEEIPRKGGPGITKSDLLVINKKDLAPPCRRKPRDHGKGCGADARREALRVFRHETGRWGGADRRFPDTAWWSLSRLGQNRSSASLSRISIRRPFTMTPDCRRVEKARESASGASPSLPASTFF